MTVTLVGLGGGTPDTLTAQGLEAVGSADCIIGARRLLEGLPSDCTPVRRAATKPGDILELLENSGAERPCVVYSGDTGFYSGTKGLLELLRAHQIDFTVLPGISSVQLLAARLGRPWQDWGLYSAHGLQCDAVAAVMDGRPAFFLTGGTLGPGELCRQLTDAGLGELEVTVGEDLSYDQERITHARAAELVGRSFRPLAVLLAEAAPRPMAPQTGGFDDELFLRDKVPMTKQEVRAAILGKLAVAVGETVWDVGAGTGSVSVELALAARRGRVWAVECKPEACRLIEQNREKFGAWNLTLVEGRAPEALSGLPAPDAVFIGGTRGSMDEVVSAVLEKNPKARICISAIALESLTAALTALTSRGLEAQVCQIAVSRTKPTGSLHLLTANNPVFLITGHAPEGGPL